MMCEICAGRKHSSASPSQCPGGQGHPAQHRANAFLSLAEVGSQPRVCRGHMWPPGAEQVKAEGTQTWPQPHHPSLATAVGCSTHHPHLGEVHQAILSVVRGALLDERQVCQVHAQVGDTRRVTTSGANQKEMRNNKKTTKKKPTKTFSLWGTGQGRGEGGSAAGSRTGRILSNTGRLSQGRLLGLIPSSAAGQAGAVAVPLTKPWGAGDELRAALTL